MSKNNLFKMVKYCDSATLANGLGVSQEMFAEYEEVLGSDILVSDLNFDLVFTKVINEGIGTVAYNYDNAYGLILKYCQESGLDSAIYQHIIMEFLNTEYRFVYRHPFTNVRYYRKSVLDDFILYESLIDRNGQAKSFEGRILLEDFAKEVGLSPKDVYTLVKHFDLFVETMDDKFVLDTVAVKTLRVFLTEHIMVKDKAIIKKLKSSNLPAVYIFMGAVFVSKSVWGYLTNSEPESESWSDFLVSIDDVDYLGEGGWVSYIYEKGISRSAFEMVLSSGLPLVTVKKGQRLISVSVLEEMVRLVSGGYSVSASALVAVGYISKYTLDTQFFSADDLNIVIMAFVDAGLIPKRIIKHLKGDDFVAISVGALRLYSRQRVLDALVSYNRGLSVKDANFRNFVSLGSLISVLDAHWLELDEVDYLEDYGLYREGENWKFSYTGQHFRYLTSEIVVLDTSYLKTDLLGYLNDYYYNIDKIVQTKFHHVVSELLKKEEAHV